MVQQSGGSVANKSRFQTMADLQRMELSKCRNLFLPLMLSEITGKLHIKESELWLEVQVFLVLTRLIHACPEAEAATAGFPPAVFLLWQKGLRCRHALWDLHPSVSGGALSLCHGYMVSYQLSDWLKGCCSEVAWGTKKGQQVPLRKGDVTPLPAHMEQSNNARHSWCEGLTACR